MEEIKIEEKMRKNSIKIYKNPRKWTIGDN